MKLTLTTIADIPLIEPGDNLVEIILEGIQKANETLEDNDILIIAQKIISKAENRYVDLSSIKPSKQAENLATEVDKDPRYVELVLRESKNVVRKKPGILIVEHHLGLILANAGIDQSNIEHRNGNERALLLPVDPDRSAKKFRQEIQKRLNVDVAIIINDSIGRAWRNGTIGMAIGISGMAALDDRIGDQDIFGRELKATSAAVADEMAAAASLIMGQTTERTPVVLARGYQAIPEETENLKGLKPLIREKSQDLFR